MNELMGIYEPEKDYRADKLRREIEEARRKGLIRMADEPPPPETCEPDLAETACTAGGVRVSFDEVTPKKAAAWLQKNSGNRRLKRDVVDSYARQMKRGEWMPIPPGIVFDEAGNLINGQHTLSAVVKAECQVLMQVTRGVPVCVQGRPEVRAASLLDSGVARNAADQMTIQHGVAAGASVIGAMVRCIVNAMLPQRTRRLSVSEIMTVYRMFEPQIHWMVENRSKQRGLKQAGVMAAFALAQAWPMLEDELSQLRGLWHLMTLFPDRLMPWPAMEHLHEYLTGECGLLMTRRDDRALLPLTLQCIEVTMQRMRGASTDTDTSSLGSIRETGPGLEDLLPPEQARAVRELFGVEGRAV